MSSFGAVAGALVIGVQLSSLGRLHGAELHWAFASLAVLFLAILAVISAAVRVLAPVRVRYQGLATAPEFEPLQKVVEVDKTLLPEGVPDLAELVKRYVAAQRYRNAIWNAHFKSPSEVSESMLADAEKATRGWYAHVMEMVWLGLALYMKRVFKQSMALIFVAILVAAAAATAFAYLSSMPTKEPKEPPKPPPKVHVSVNEPKTCVDLYLALDDLADDERNIGSHWPTSSLGAQDQACGFHNVKELDRFLSFLAHH